MNFNIKKGSTGPSLVMVLQDSTGTALNLTGATVTFSMTPARGSTPKINDAACVIVSASAGKIRYDWQASDTDTIGSFDAEVTVTWADGKIERFPSKGYITVVVERSL